MTRFPTRSSFHQDNILTKFDDYRTGLYSINKVFLRFDPVTSFLTGPDLFSHLFRDFSKKNILTLKILQKTDNCWFPSTIHTIETVQKLVTTNGLKSPPKLFTRQCCVNNTPEETMWKKEKMKEINIFSSH